MCVARGDGAGRPRARARWRAAIAQAEKMSGNIQSVTTTLTMRAKSIIGEEQWKTAVRRAKQCERSPATTQTPLANRRRARAPRCAARRRLLVGV